MFVQPGIIYEKGPDFIPVSNWKRVPFTISWHHLLSAYPRFDQSGRYEGVRALLISHIIISLCCLWHEVRTEGKRWRFGPVTCWYWCVGGLSFAKNSESSYLLTNAMVHCQCGKFLKTQRWKVRDVTCDGVKIQKGLQLISSLMSACIFPTMFQMLMIEVERVLQSKSAAVFMREHTVLRSVSSWETSGALLGTHITITVKANVQQSSSLPSSPAVMVQPVLKNYAKLYFLPTAIMTSCHG